MLPVPPALVPPGLPAHRVPTCTEEQFTWRPPFGEDTHMLRYRLIAGARTIQTGLFLTDRYPHDACINDREFHLGHHELTDLLIKLGMSFSPFMHTVHARQPCL